MLLRVQSVDHLDKDGCGLMCGWQIWVNIFVRAYKIPTQLITVPPWHFDGEILLTHAAISL